MPIDYKDYPPYWKQFSLYIRVERAGNKCERCKAPNGENVARGTLDGEAFWHDPSSGIIYAAKDGLIIGRARDYELNAYTERYTTIVLTVAHLDHDGGVCDCKVRTGRKCARADHVLALCQKCHLAADLPHHLAKRAKTLAAKKDAERGFFAEAAVGELVQVAYSQAGGIADAEPRVIRPR